MEERGVRKEGPQMLSGHSGRISSSASSGSLQVTSMFRDGSIQIILEKTWCCARHLPKMRPWLDTLPLAAMTFRHAGTFLPV